MEKSSIEFYEAAKSKTKFDEARKLFDLLIKWEKYILNNLLSSIISTRQTGGLIKDLLHFSKFYTGVNPVFFMKLVV